MSLRDRAERCDEIVRWAENVRHGGFAGPTPAGVQMRVDDVQALAHQWGGDVLTGPDGDPGEVRTSAERYAGIATGLRSTGADLRTRAGEVEGALEGDSGAATVVATEAFADLADLEADGADVVAAALRDYAGSLDAAQSAHRSHGGALETARNDAYALDVPASSADTAECRTALRRADGVLDDAIAAAAGCADAFRQAADAEDVLRRALGDAAGYARLSGFRPTSTTSRIDAVLALAAGVGDPDKAVVSADEWAAYVAARDDLSAADRARLDTALADARTPEERQMIVSALATGAGLTLTLALARRLGTMPASSVRRLATLGIAEPGASAGVRLPDGTVVTQQTGTTCGSSSLLMLAAQRDPFLALFLAEGELVDGHVPEYVSDIPMVDRIPDDSLTSQERLEYLQTQIRIQTNNFTFWPGSAVGSAPWGYGDEVSRILGRDVAMEYSLVGPAGDPRDLVERAVASVDSGTPVPFLVGPGGTNVPRHYVLLVGHSDGVLEFYEPTSGELRTATIDEAVAGDERVHAFGYEAIYGAAIPE